MMDTHTIKERYMADITMCQSKTCKKRGYCYRYKAVPDRFQSYFTDDPSDPKDGCDFFWDMRPVEDDDEI